MPEGNQHKVGLEPGTMVDHYRIIRPIGAGGMAEVYLARDTMLGRKVALKIIHPLRKESKDAVERFLLEAKATARFNHPHIITIHGVGISSSGPYLALEHLEGQTLRERIEQERLGVKEAIRIAKAIAAALCVAHEKETLHRDLKPANIMMARDGRLRVLDFGLSQLVHATQTSLLESPDNIQEPSIKPDGYLKLRKKVLGTPSYMAPEQWRAKKVGPPADIWALGLILYEMLAGHHPYHKIKKNSELNSLVISPAPVPKPTLQSHIPSDLMILLKRCLEKQPELRPTAQDVWLELERLLSGNKQEDLTGMSPFRGLMSFEEEHSQLFFGREVEVNSFVEQLRQETVLPVVGVSGAGKSSFVKAGVIPRLREKGPLILLQLRPGQDPFITLAARLVTAWQQPSHTMGGTQGPLGSMTGLHTPTSKSAQQPIGEAGHLAKQLFEQPKLLSLWLYRLAEHNRAYVVLFVDQLEELCAVDSDPQNNAPSMTQSSKDIPSGGVAERFMQALAGAADDPQLPVRVILTIREEFLTRLMTGALVRKALNKFTILRKPSRKTLLEILQRSVKAVGYQYEDFFLANQLTEDVRDVVACLPLLQFSCQVLWQNRDKQRRVLTRLAYEEMGGVAGALIQHAEGVLKGLNTHEVDLAKTLLLRLVTEDKTRRILNRHELLEGLKTGAGQVLDKLVESRLVTISRQKEGRKGDCELIHEALISQWDTLNRWIEENREEIRLVRQIEQAADLWDRRKRRVDDLWSARALKEAQALIKKNDSFTKNAQDFIKASERQIRLRRLGRAVFLGIVLLVLVAAVWAGNSILALHQCQAGANKINQVWNDQVKQKIEKGFLGSGVYYAKHTLSKVNSALDAYAGKWAANYIEICETTDQKDDHPEEVRFLKLDCLSKKLKDLGALTKVFIDADDVVIEKAIQAAESLPNLATCKDLESLRSRIPPPRNEQIRKQVESIRDGLVRVGALSKTSRYRKALEQLHRIENTAKTIDYPPVQAKVLYQLGQLLYKTGDYKSAEAKLYEAARTAGIGKDDRLVANVMSYLVFIVGYAQGRPEDGLLIARYAEIEVEQAGGDAKLRAQLFSNIGSVYLGQADYNNALDYYQKSLALDEKILGPDNLDLAISYNNIGIVYILLEDYAKGLEYQTKALAIRRKVLGNEHPEVAQSLHNLGTLFLNHGEYEKAIDFFNKSLAIREKTLEPEHPQQALSMYSIGEVYSKKGQLEKALEYHRKALAIREKVLGIHHPLVAQSLSSIGDILIEKGVSKQALEPLEQALNICENVTCEAETHGRALFNLARLLATRGDTKRAIKLAKKAREEFAKLPKRLNRLVEEVSSWLNNLPS